MSDFACRARDADGTVVVAVSGDVDIATCERMVAMVAAHLPPRGRVVLDCSAVGFMDSCGLRGMLELRRLAAWLDATFALAAPSPDVLRVLDVSGTRAMFRIADVALPEGRQPSGQAACRLRALATAPTSPGRSPAGSHTST